MGKRGGSKRTTNKTPLSQNPISLREEVSGKKQTNVKSRLKHEHLQNLAVWVSSEASIPSLAAFFGHRLATDGEVSVIAPNPSFLPCQRCETILRPGFNCTVHIEKIRAKVRHGCKKPQSLTQNNVVFKCHFCSHGNLKKGTPKGHMKGICPCYTLARGVSCPPKLKAPPISKAVKSVSSDTNEDKDKPCNVEVIPLLAIAEEALLMDNPTTPLVRTGRTLLDGNKRKRNKSGSRRSAECNGNSTTTDAEKTVVMRKVAVEKNPEASRQFVWNHLRQAFSFYDTEPCENNLLQHMLLINQTVKRDEDLMKSKYVVTFLEKPSTGQPSPEGIQKIMKTGFIVDEDEDNVVNSDGEEIVSNSIFDTVCSICDNGGTVLCCEGSCLRSFHPTKADGSDSLCQSLGFLNHVQVDALPSFLCKNCLYKQHQCYACGKLGSSDTSKGQEVFSCSSATCGHFYHPECVSRLLHIGNENEVLKLQATIAAGKSFTCPMHKCYICKQSEDAAVHGLQMAICRCCPKAYHRKCLPKMITLEFTTDKNLLRRAWYGLLPENRILIYCMDHKIDIVLGTPSRDHLKFPDLEGKEKQDKLEVPSCKGKVTDSIQSMSSEHFAANRPPMKKAKLFQKFGSDIEAYNENTDEKCSRQDFDILKKPIGETAKNYLEKNSSSDIERHLKTDKSKFLPTKGNTKLNLGSAMGTLGEVSSRSSKIRNTVQTMPMVKPLVTLDMEKGIRTLMKNSASSFNVEEFKKRRQIPVTYACNPCKMLDKTITFGWVEASVRAVQAALEKLEAGGSIEDAKTICGPEVLKQIGMWKEKLKVFLAPFLHGMRYTSFGCHFTKLEKLKEIVDRLCWYVQNGDTIVDYSCGSNDFSCLMKEKLENMGKFCSFKNYDLFRPKVLFAFSYITTRAAILF
ncbi:hypothetical protein SLA2020_285900, partial [Shorea laevis]